MTTTLTVPCCRQDSSACLGSFTTEAEYGEVVVPDVADVAEWFPATDLEAEVAGDDAWVCEHCLTDFEREEHDALAERAATEVFNEHVQDGLAALQDHANGG